MNTTGAEYSKLRLIYTIGRDGHKHREEYILCISHAVTD
jgi:hypothetical protein